MKHVSGWLSRTRQVWKIGVFYALSILAALGLLGGVRRVTYGRHDPVGILVIFLSICGASVPVVWLALSVRCFRCGARPFAQIVLHGQFSRIGESLVQLQVCPRCGDGGGSGKPERSRVGTGQRNVSE